MKISLSLLSVGMIAAAASASGTDTFIDYTGGGLMSRAPSVPSEAFANTIYTTGFNSAADPAGPYVLGDARGQGTPAWQDGGTIATAWTIVSTTAAQPSPQGANTTNKLRGAWGSNAATSPTSFFYQDNAGAGYGHSMAGTRTGVDFDLMRLTNSNSANKGQIQLRTYDTAFAYTAMGFIFDNFATGTSASIRGLAYLGGPGVTSAGTYAFTLETGTFHRDSIMHHYYTAYDACTGIITWGWDKGLASEKEWYFDTAGYQGGAAYQVNEFDFLSVRNTATTAGGMLIDNVSLTWEACPAPGAAALLGLAGLAGRRRRA